MAWIFDEFSRTVSSSWGVTKYGQNWATNFTASLISVGTDYGKFTVPDASTLYHTQPYINDIGGTSPWIGTTAITMTVKLKASAILTSSNYVSASFGFLRYASSNVSWVDAQFSSPAYVGLRSGGSGGSQTVSPTLVANQWYIIIAEFIPNVSLKMRMFPEGSDPGTWDVSFSDVGYGPMLAGDAFVVDLFGRGTVTLSIDYVDFDYTGKVYLPFGVSTAIDDWNDRTIASSSAQTYPFAWGYTSGTHNKWQNGGQWNAGPTSDINYSVASGVGRVDHTNHGTGTGNKTSSFISLNNGNSGFIPWSLSGTADFPTVLVSASPLMFSIDFMVDDVTKWKDSEMDMGAYSGTYDVVYGYFNGGFGAPYASNSWSIFGRTSSANIPITWVSGTWYTYKVLLSGTTVQVKLWDRSTTEPDWQVSQTGMDSRPWTLDSFSEWGMMLETLGADGTHTNFYFDNFVTYTDQVSAPEPAPAVQPTTPSVDRDYGVVGTGWGSIG